jgi:hypothetical protein
MMKKLHLIVTLAGLLLPARLLSAEAPVVVTVSLPYSTILPGVPFDIDVTLKNVSAKPVTAGLIAHLIVTLADGPEIRPEDQTVLDPHLISSPETSIVLAPGESVERVVTWSHSVPNWSSDPRFSGVGTYDIALELTDPESSRSVRSSSARLVRTVAPGDDLELWTRMQAIGEGRWSDDGFRRIGAARELVAEILNAHSSSGYYPYALLLRTPPALRDDLEPSLEAAKRFTDSPAYAHLLLHAADAAYSAAASAEYRRDQEAAAQFYQRASELYARTLETKSLAVRGIASQRKQVAVRGAEKYRGRSR